MSRGSSPRNPRARDLEKVQEENIIHHVVKPNVERESEFD
jgi:hypothetical protein